MRLAQLQLVQVEGEEGQPGLVLQPLAQRGEADAASAPGRGTQAAAAKRAIRPRACPARAAERLVEVSTA